MSESIPATIVVPPAAPDWSRIDRYLYRGEHLVADWFHVLKVCLYLILACGLYAVIEQYVLQVSPRLIANPAGFACRFFGFSHFAVGLLFLLTSKKMRRVEGWAWLVGLLGVGVVIATVFTRLGGDKNPVMVILYFLFFMIHGYRDLVFFYRTTTADPVRERLRSQILTLTQVSLLVILFYVYASVFLFLVNGKLPRYKPEVQAQVDALIPYLHIGLQWAWLGLLGLFAGLWRLVRRWPERAADVWTANRAVFLVLIYATLIIMTGPWTFDLLILSHFVGWYFYARRQLAMRPKQSTVADGLWKWFRNSASGFQRLHLGAAAAFLMAIVIDHFVLERTGFVNTLLSQNAFFVWTILHVCISFAPRS
jgi:hypothetical protein